ncbi:ERF family protein [Micromonospora sp. NPDC023814]|uniref:ERF family protein n=1 Tax=Micromonospora sp. NPDC023814 TaxID=3154596 RepID=UPI0033C71346
MSKLRERVEQADGWPTAAEPGAGPAPAETPERPTMQMAPLEDVNYDGNEIHDAEAVPVQVAFARVMSDVQSIGKKDQRADSGGRYDFRGVDRVVNAVGPALRRHGVLMLPSRLLSVEYVEARTSGGKAIQECRVQVEWTVMGPKGDTLPTTIQSAGQATDTQDKATAKAISVAQRTVFLSALHIPTQDPDIDRGHERGDRPAPKAADYRDEITDPRTSLGRLRQIRVELQQHRLATARVTNEVGEEEALLDMVDRVGRQRREVEQ